jgi:DNA polymerase (family 10)
MMSNKEIVQLFKLATALMELHEENTFKIRTYANAVINLDRHTLPLAAMSIEELKQMEGVGKSIAGALEQIQQKGTFDYLEELKAQTPAGVLEMVGIKGIGPKKVRTIWKNLGIETTGALMEACKAGRVARLSGFGKKTEETILKALEFRAACRGMATYARTEPLVARIEQHLQQHLPQALVSPAGEYRRKLEVITRLELVVGYDDLVAGAAALDKMDFLEKEPEKSGPFTWLGKDREYDLQVKFVLCPKADFYSKLLIHTGSENHLAYAVSEGKSLYTLALEAPLASEDSAYITLGMQPVPPELREGSFEIALAQTNALPRLVEYADLKGAFHNHTTYSDGRHTLRQMAEYCIAQGWEYLGISDHSKSAFYAKGLQEFRIVEQHAEIDQLNEELKPFVIFKGIESDILSDGALDYHHDVLASFDFVVASVHTVLTMDEQKATARLIKAIENPYTTFLGHPTGRLLLQREGYPIDHRAVIEACAAHGVIMEINANPRRLDLDWRWVNFAMERGVTLSINPDAHATEGLTDMYYGVSVGRKGGLTKAGTFNAQSLAEVQAFFKSRKK